MVKKKKVLGKYIVADPEICHGKLTFRGTRVMVKDVIELVSEGMPWKKIAEEYDGAISEQAIAEAVRLAAQAVEKYAKTLGVPA